MNYNELNALIDAYVNRNGVQAITGQILNGVLKMMVEQLGRGYTIMGAADPTTDPGTPDGPESYFASEVGTYTNFGGLQIVPGELALLCYTPGAGWTKETVYEGFQQVTAQADDNIGVPSVGVSYSNGVLSFNFRNIKGEPGENGQDGQDGDPAGFGQIGADITGGVGTPGVSVESSGPATAKNLQFHFTNLKGETGVTSVLATVDNTSGNPQCAVSLVGQQLTLAFTGIKGEQGDTGVSADYPIAVINNLTTNDPASALSAAQGVVLQGEISQLEAKLAIKYGKNDSPFPIMYGLVNYSASGAFVSHQGFITRRYYARDMESVRAYCGSINADPAAIAFWSGTDITNIQNYISGIQASYGSHWYEAQTIPAGAVLVTVTNRMASLADADHIIDIKYKNPEYLVGDINKTETRFGVEISATSTQSIPIKLRKGAKYFLHNENTGYTSVNVYTREGAEGANIDGAFVSWPGSVVEIVPTTDANFLYFSADFNGRIYCESVFGEDVSEIKEKTVVVLGKDDSPYPIISGFVAYADGTVTSDAGMTTRLYDCQDIKSIHCYIGAVNGNPCAIAFFSSKKIGPDSFMKSDSVDAYYNPRWYNVYNIPEKAVIVAISNKISNVPEADHKIEITYGYRYLLQRMGDISGYDLNSVKFEQGNYSNGQPQSVATRVRINRIIRNTELPVTVKVPDGVDARIYGYNLYSGYEYADFVSYTAVSSDNYKELTFENFPSGVLGLTLVFSRASDIGQNISPSDMNGVKISHVGLVNGLEGEINTCLDYSKAVGNQVYYGRVQTLKVTDEKHKLTSREKLTHIYSDYSHTVYNQSMAIWDGKYFCFNDTQLNEFCVVIDMATNNVLDLITTIPAEIGQSHLNNAVFTDKYYLADDKYPLLLLSRGDYAGNSPQDEACHIMRITESGGHFVFTHIKKILFHTRYTHFGASYCFDRERNMLWGYCFTQDWRYAYTWGGNNFNGSSLPIYSESAYICITSGGAVAAVSTDIEITVGNVTRTVHISAGSELKEVFPFTPNLIGVSFVSLTQRDAAFSGRWVAYDCDENGDDKIEIVCKPVLVGFNCPELADDTQIEMKDEDIVSLSFIDMGIFQGGCCANGKLFLPFQNYETINGSPTSFTAHCCLVVNPNNGYIESIIPTDNVLENEGCAIYLGKLYISSHNGGATEDTPTPCFRIMEYSFD